MRSRSSPHVTKDELVKLVRWCACLFCSGPRGALARAQMHVRACSAETWLARPFGRPEHACAQFRRLHTHIHSVWTRDEQCTRARTCARARPLPQEADQGQVAAAPALRREPAGEPAAAAAGAAMRGRCLRNSSFCGLPRCATGPARLTAAALTLRPRPTPHHVNAHLPNVWASTIAPAAGCGRGGQHSGVHPPAARWRRRRRRRQRRRRVCRAQGAHSAPRRRASDSGDAAPPGGRLLPGHVR